MDKPASRSWDDARHILCVRLDTLGDVVMTTPAFRALREGRSDRRLTLLTSPPGAEAGRLAPWLDEVLVYDAPWMKATAPRHNSEPELAMIQRLREQHFDAAIVFTVFSQNPLPSAVLCYLADIPLRLAYCHENPYQLLTNWIPDPDPAEGIRHETRRQLDLVASIGCRTTDERLSLQISAVARWTARRRLSELGINESRLWVLMHPGASAASRRYPPEQFAMIGDRLVRELDCQVIFTGSADESVMVEWIRTQMSRPSSSLVGQLDLEQLAALIELAPLLIANNTGPVHVAAAMQTPVVDLYALTNPQHTPWMVPNRTLFHDVLCKNCFKSVCPEGHHDCLRLVSPDSVVLAVRELLAIPQPQREPEAAPTRTTKRCVVEDSPI